MLRPALGIVVVTALVSITTGTIPVSAQEMKKRVGRPFNAYVVTIADGDTLELIPDGEQRPIRIRLEGIDTPELDEPFGRDAMAYTRVLLFKKRVRVAGRDVDRYDRLVARVTTSGRDASLALLQMGLACHFTQFASDPVLAAAQARARDRGVGFWAPTAPKPRCVGPAAPAAKAGTSFRGNVSSRIYHASSCPNANCRNCTRVFSTEEEAKSAGFAPAGDCTRKLRN